MIYSFYRDRLTGKLLTHSDLLKRFPNTSFPAGMWTTSVFDFINCDPVMETVAPNAPDEYTIVVQDGYEKMGNTWVVKWKFQDRFATQEEKLQFVKEQTDNKWKSIREQRNQLLKDTDHTQVLDYDFSLTESCKLEFEKYRQQLRDITNQPDPFNIIWPDEPTCK